MHGSYEVVFDSFVASQVEVDFDIYSLWLQGFSEEEIVRAQATTLRAAGRRRSRDRGEQGIHSLICIYMKHICKLSTQAVHSLFFLR